MFTRFTTIAVLTAVIACPTASAAPVTVQLRVEGATTTIFEGPVTTDGKTIDKGSGPHPCDGTNLGSNPEPGPTLTSALDDASLGGAFSWDGTWFDGFDDFGIDRVGPDSTDFAANRYWGYALNFVALQIGGCQQQVQGGDGVLFGYDFFSKAHLLRLSGPGQVGAGQFFSVKVVDGQTGLPISGAAVGGSVTRSNGEARVSFATAGLQSIKAERPDAIRSNRLLVCVTPTQGGGCGLPASQFGTSGPAARDSKAPRARISHPRSGRRYRRGPRLLRGTARDDGSGVSGVELSLRRYTGGRCSQWSGRRERFVGRRCGTASYFDAGQGPRWSYLMPRALPRGRYVLDVKVVDRSGNDSGRPVRGESRVVFRVLGRPAR